MTRISALFAKVRARAGLIFSYFSVLFHLFDGHACSIAEAEAGEGFVRGLKRLVGLAEGKSHVVACHKKARFFFSEGGTPPKKKCGRNKLQKGPECVLNTDRLAYIANSLSARSLGALERA